MAGGGAASSIKGGGETAACSAGDGWERPFYAIDPGMYVGSFGEERLRVSNRTKTE